MVWYDFALRIFAALSQGAMIGAERQLRQRLAGLRTNALVAAGSALFVTSSLLSDDPQGVARIAAQVVSGIGFLGADVIMREGLSVRGLNTAATLWCSAAVGVLAGMNHAAEAALGTLFVLGANFVLRSVAHRINTQNAAAATEVKQAYRVTAVCGADEETHVRNLVLHMLNGMPSLLLQSLHSEDTHQVGKIEVRADVLATPGQQALLEQIVSRVSMERSASLVRWAVLNGHKVSRAEI